MFIRPNVHMAATDWGLHLRCQKVLEGILKVFYD